MKLRWLGVSFAFTLALAAQPAAANQDVACPEGQAIQAIGDKTAACVPVPPPVDLAPLNAAISAETAARKARTQGYKVQSTPKRWREWRLTRTCGFSQTS